ncbi:hypothetical protein, partial [Angustibacter speluncae]
MLPDRLDVVVDVPDGPAAAQLVPAAGATTDDVLAALGQAAGAVLHVDGVAQAPATPLDRTPVRDGSVLSTAPSGAR